MTHEQAAAFVNAQTALLNARIAGMAAENMQRAAVGHSMAYDQSYFAAVKREFEAVLSRDAVMTLFGESP